MMRAISGYLLLLGDSLLRLLPVLVTLALFGAQGDGGSRENESRKKESRKKLLLLALAAAAGHFLLYLLLHRLFLHGFDISETVQKILKVQFSYQDIDFFTCSYLTGMAAAVVLGCAGNHIAAVFRKDFGISVFGRKGKKCFLFLSAAAAGMVALACCLISGKGSSRIVINEVWGNNKEAVDAEGKEVMPDYIELYNTGALACELDGLYLSDNGRILKKKTVPPCTVLPGGYALILLDDGSFSLDGGETIFLSNRSGRILDSVEMEDTGTYFSYARQADGGQAWAVFGCTPGMANADGAKWVESPVFSREGGFYQDAFDLELFSEPGTEIYYTLDGSRPTEKSFLYRGPIHIYNRSGEENVYRAIPNVVPRWQDTAASQKPVDKAFVVRAVAVDREGGLPRFSSPVTATYFIGLNEYSQRTVVSLVADPGDLFGDGGICVTGQDYDQWYLNGQEGDAPYMNFVGKGREWEIAADFEYFSEKLAFSQKVGMRVFGGTSRGFPRKNFSLYARKEYGGSPVFDQCIFEGIASHKLVLRGGFANALCQALAKGRAVAVQDSIPVSVFLNGEFWYHTNLMEKYDGRYFEQRYGIASDNLVLFSQGLLDIGREEDLALEGELYEFLDGHDMRQASNYQALGEIMDLQSYIDFMCINIYIDNMDFDNMKNVVMWRARDAAPGPYGDGKWRWALYDLDAMEWGDAGDWGLSASQEKNTFCLLPRDKQSEISVNQQRIYAALKASPDFCRQFVLTFMDLANEDFSYGRVKAAIDAYGYEPDGYQGGRKGGVPQDAGYYDSFFRERASWIIPYMAEEFGLSGTPEAITLSVNDPEAGEVLLNTIMPDLSDGAWSGEYYTDYPVAVTAKARAGYEFVRWEKTGGAGRASYTEKTVEVPVEKGGIELKAVFKKSG